jgi:CheY-like chemotaxis protein
MKRKEPSYKYQYAMLLDDNELDNFINQKTLEANYFANKIYVNTSSKSALEFLTNIETSVSEDFDIFPEIIFIDINMPMIDGFQFIENLKNTLPKRFQKLKVVILTSSLSSTDKEKSSKISTGITFINKPLTKEALNQL